MLAYRRENAEFFSRADYEPLTISGERSDWAFGFVRSLGERRLAVIVARFPAKREAEPDWRAFARLPAGDWTDILDGARVDPEAPVTAWLGALPYAVLETR